MPIPVSPQTLRSLQTSDDTYAIIDVRARNEYEQEQILGAVHIPRQLLEFRISQSVPVSSTTLVVYDDDGSRAVLAAKTLARYGYTQVRYLAGGLAAWKQAGYPVVYGVHVFSKTFGEIVGETPGLIASLQPGELQRRLAEQPDQYAIIEVRPADEVRKTGSIPGAVTIPGVELPLAVGDIAKTGKSIVITCAGRTRGLIASATLKRMGIESVYDLNNGTLGWQLAGFDLARDIPPGPPPSADSLARANAFADKLVREQSIKQLSGDTVELLRRRADAEPLYLLDVRTEAEYALGHIPGAISIPGGQAIQNSDDIVPVQAAQIVFICDSGVRSAITAYWYREMGFPRVAILAGGLDAWSREGREIVPGAGTAPPLGLAEAAKQVQSIDAAALFGQRQQTVVLDVGDSRSFAAGHIAAAHWLPRGRLEQRIGQTVPDKNTVLVITGPDGAQPVFAALTLAELGYRQVSVLKDGNAAWAAAGYPLQAGLGGIVPDDWHVHLTEYGQQEAIRYFEWEESLTGLDAYMEPFRRRGVAGHPAK